MNEALLRESLNKSFNSNINLRLVKPNTYQIFLPYFHSDGDMVDIFIQFVWSRMILTDFWQTLMRLSYYTDLNANGRKSVFNSIISAYNVEYDQTKGIISISFSTEEELFPSIMEMITVITKVSDISYLRSERVKSLFYEEFENFVMGDVRHILGEQVSLKKDYSPNIDGGKGYTSPFAALKEGKDPLLLFPVLNTDKCKEAIMALLFYQTKNFKNNSIIMFNNLEDVKSEYIWKLVDLADRPLSTYNSDNKNKILSYAEAWSH